MEPHHLCAYMYRLSCAFADFYRDCRVIDRQAEEVVMKSPIEGEIRVKTGQKQYVHEHRLALCVAAARVLKQSCQLLGLDTVDKI